MRAQREVMWNLQKDYVVTVVGPGDDPVPYKRQGNPDVNTPLSVKHRLALRKQPLIQVTPVPLSQCAYHRDSNNTVRHGYFARCDPVYTRYKRLLACTLALA